MTTIHIETRKPVAYDSPDHIQPHGTAENNTTQPRFNRKLVRLYPGPRGPPARPRLRRWRARQVDPRRRRASPSGSRERLLPKDQACRVGDDPRSPRSRPTRRPFHGYPRSGVTGRGDRSLSMSSPPGSSSSTSPNPASQASPRTSSDISPPKASFSASIATYPDVVNGVVLHQISHQKPWWIKTFYQLDLEHQESLERDFHFDMVNGQPTGGRSTSRAYGGARRLPPRRDCGLDPGKHAPPHLADAAMDVAARGLETPRLADETSDREPPARRPSFRMISRLAGPGADQSLTPVRWEWIRRGNPLDLKESQVFAHCAFANDGE